MGGGDGDGDGDEDEDETLGGWGGLCTGLGLRLVD